VWDVKVSEHELATEVGAPEGFATFYRREYRSIRALCWTLTGDVGTAEDVTQEAFLRAHSRWDDVQGYDEPGAWVRRVAINLATSVLRRRGREVAALLRFRMQRGGQWELPAEDLEFWGAVRSLPRGQAAVIALHYYEDLPVSDIARVLDLAEGTVKAQLHNGRRALAKKLRPEGGQT